MISFFSGNIWDKDKVGSFIFEQILVFSQPLYKFFGGKKLNEEGSFFGYIYFVKNLSSLFGVIVDPDDKIGFYLW